MQKLHKLIALAALLTLSGAQAGVLSFFNPSQANDFDEVSLKAQAFAADDPVSLHDLFNGWSGEYHPKDGDNIAIDDLRTDIGVSFKRWGYLGYTYRHHSFITASKDLTLLAWQQLNDRGFTQGKLYDLDISVKGFEADGIVYSKCFALFETEKRALKVGIAAEFLRGRAMQDGYLRGNAIANSSKDYDFSAVSDYYYTKNYLYNLEVEKAEGYGYTTHLDIEFENERLILKLLLNDLYGKIVWKRLPYSHVNINSSNKKYDENGYVVYNPTVSGIEKYVDHTQKLYIKSRLEGSYKYSENTKATIGSDYVSDTFFPYISISHIFIEKIHGKIFYERRFGMVGLKIHYRNLHFFAASNDLRKPSAIKVNLSVAYSF